MNYEQDVRIDPSALDVEWLRQPGLVFQYGKLAAEWERRVEKSRRRMDVARAELDSAIRKNPTKFKLDKATETAINNVITSHPDYSDAHSEYLENKYEWEMAKAANRALNDKRSSLENLVRLYGQNYFAGPKLPRDLDHEWEKQEQQRVTNTKVGEAMQTRRRRSV